MSEYTLYMHINNVNQKKYIGVTNNIKRRWRNGGCEYKPHKSENQNRGFWNAIKKYGFDSFEHIILLEGMTFDEAIEKEIECIGRYDTTNKSKGYNISKGGNGGLIYSEHPKGMKGKKQTKHQIENHKEWASNPENNCMKNGSIKWGVTHEHPRGMKGKKHTDEHKKNVSVFMTESHPNFKKCYALYPDGTKKEFKSPKFLCEYFNISSVTSSIYQMMKKEPYKVKPNNRTNKRYDLEGIRIIFENDKVNTEVN